MSAPHRPSWVSIDVAAVTHNTRILSQVVAAASLCAVVKADGYGHGAVDVARAALQGGAALLAVAMVDEGIELREAGIAAPILTLSEPAPVAMRDALAARLTPTLYSNAGIDAACAAARALETHVPVHVKVDTGMHRVGVDEGELLDLARRVVEAPELYFEGFWTHFAVADQRNDPFTDLQLRRFLEAGAQQLARAGVTPRLIHAGNSAAAIAYPACRFDMVRTGIALYGYLPSESVSEAFAAQVPPGDALVPVASLRSRVHFVRRLAAGERPSYGRIYPLAREGFVATVPLGYADGVTKALGRCGAEVLINGKRRRIAGEVSMDYVMIDLGDDDAVSVDDEVVFIGRQGDDEITAWEWARYLNTIPYEVLCGIGPRVPRVVEPSGLTPEIAKSHNR